MFALDRHASFFQHSLRLLPYHYTQTDTTRLALIFFCVSALDLLGYLPLGNQQCSSKSKITKDEVERWKEWVYSTCLLPTRDAFRCSPATAVPHYAYSLPTTHSDKVDYDVGHTAGTYFALCILIILRDDFSRLDRVGMMRWLRKCQRADGSFAAGVLRSKSNALSDSLEERFGERDLRFGYCAAAARWLIGGDILARKNVVEDIDVDRVLGYITSCVSYEGGIAMSPYAEGHAGGGYCGVGTISLLSQGKVRNVLGDVVIDALVRWSLMHQVYAEVDPESDSEDESDSEVTSVSSSDMSLRGPKTDIPAGFTGRINKPADTCYCFWSGATLEMLDVPGTCSPSSMTGSLRLSDIRSNIMFLLTQTQNTMIGGFSKVAGAHPDLMHGYLGVAALAMCADVIREQGGPEKFVKDEAEGEIIASVLPLKSVDGTLCLSTSAKQYAEELRAKWEKE
ncbi:terpenoid cyclases/protein prenyltransferase alpha-alpha toroid [Lipomyces mesembrius]